MLLPVPKTADSKARSMFRKAYEEAARKRAEKLAWEHAGGKRINRWVGSTTGFLQVLEEKAVDLRLRVDVGDGKERETKIPETVARDAVVLTPERPRPIASAPIRRPIRMVGSLRIRRYMKLFERKHVTSDLDVRRAMVRLMPAKYTFRKYVAPSSNVTTTMDQRVAAKDRTQRTTNRRIARARWLSRRNRVALARAELRRASKNSSLVHRIQSRGVVAPRIRRLRIAVESPNQLRWHEYLEQTRKKMHMRGRWHRRVVEAKKSDLWDAISTSQERSKAKDDAASNKPRALEPGVREGLIEDVEAYVRSGGGW